MDNPKTPNNSLKATSVNGPISCKAIFIQKNEDPQTRHNMVKANPSFNFIIAPIQGFEHGKA
jgi:hypothetical protein